MDFEELKKNLKNNRKRWIVTGSAGFIGSHLVEALLSLDQDVVGLDNFFSGKRDNLKHIEKNVAAEQWKRFKFIEGDIRDPKTCASTVRGGDFVLHQAAVGSVPRSIEDPWTTHDVNVNGTFQMMLAARDARVSRFVYASSSSVYGDEPNLPKIESRIGAPLSPYALSKRMNEEYADVFSRVYGLTCIGLRYFNVFGPRQDPHGAYAAVIPKWVDTLKKGNQCEVFGDGTNSRDFCFVENVVQANIRAALVTDSSAINQAYNIGLGGRTDLKMLYDLIQSNLAKDIPAVAQIPLSYKPARDGDIPHSQADVSRAEKLLQYAPTVELPEGIRRTVEWFKDA